MTSLCGAIEQFIAKNLHFANYLKTCNSSIATIDPYSHIEFLSFDEQISNKFFHSQIYIKTLLNFCIENYLRRSKIYGKMKRYVKIMWDFDSDRDSLTENSLNLFKIDNCETQMVRTKLLET
jgi:hypothetical protein